MRFFHVAPVLMTAALIAGCGTSQDGASSSTADPAPTSARSGTDAAESAGGRMLVEYGDAESPDAVRGRQVLQDAKMLEDMADGVNLLLELPYDIPLVGAECGMENAAWEPNDQLMLICYEMIGGSEQEFAAAGAADPL